MRFKLDIKAYNMMNNVTMAKEYQTTFAIAAISRSPKPSSVAFSNNFSDAFDIGLYLKYLIINTKNGESYLIPLLGDLAPFLKQTGDLYTHTWKFS